MTSYLTGITEPTRSQIVKDPILSLISSSKNWQYHHLLANSFSICFLLYLSLSGSNTWRAQFVHTILDLSSLSTYTLVTQFERVYRRAWSLIISLMTFDGWAYFWLNKHSNRLNSSSERLSPTTCVLSSNVLFFII